MPGRAPCAARRVYALSCCAHFVLPFAVTGGIVKVGRGQAGVFPPARVVVAAYAFGALGGFLLPVLALLNSLYGFIEAFCTVQDSQDFKPFSFERCCDKLFQLANVHAFVPFHVFHLPRWFCRLAHRRPTPPPCSGLRAVRTRPHFHASEYSVGRADLCPPAASVRRAARRALCHACALCALGCTAGSCALRNTYALAAGGARRYNTAAAKAAQTMKGRYIA